MRMMVTVAVEFFVLSAVKIAVTDTLLGLGVVGGAVYRPLALIVPVVGLIVAGSYGMVETAVDLADRWSVPGVIVGTLVLATLTSLPNAYTALRLGLQRRGVALVSESLNSNTINLGGGLVLPALVTSLAAVTGLVTFDLAWLLGMTLVTVGLLARRHRKQGQRERGLRYECNAGDHPGRVEVRIRRGREQDGDNDR